MVFSYI